MPHFRYNIKDWPMPIKKLPELYCVKAVDNVQMLAEAKSVNPGIVRSLRHYTSDQTPSDTYEGNKVKARTFLKTFIDGTFLNGETKGVKHRTTEYIEDWNEYGWFNSQDEETKRRFRLWAIAFLDVWYEEYWPDLGTNVIVGNIPVGNNLDLEVAKRVAYWTNLDEGRIPRVGYHSYWPVQNKVIVGQDSEEGWWKWYAGRFAMIDADLLSRGIRIHWALTEAGAIGAYGTWPGISLGPNDGWRQGFVHGGDMNSYLVTTDMFMKKWSTWNEANGYRCLSPNMYDSSQGIDEWKSFQLWSGDLDKIITNVFTSYPTKAPEKAPPPPPPPATIKTLGFDVSRWQGAIKWDWSAREGIKFAFIKATQGTSWLDPQFERNWLESESNGIPAGPYHFYEPDQNGKDQAEWFHDSVVDAGDKYDLPFVVDVEKAPAAVGTKVFQTNLWDFLLRIGELTKRKPLIYTSPGFYNRWMVVTREDEQRPWGEISDLWIAHWGVSKPTVPKAWDKWIFWQYGVFDDGYKYGAASASIDLDWFNGTEDELAEYANKEPEQPSDLYELKSEANIRLHPQHDGEAGKYNKIATLPAKAIVKVIEWVEGATFQGSRKWAKIEPDLVYVNGKVVVTAYIHSALIQLVDEE